YSKAGAQRVAVALQGGVATGNRLAAECGARTKTIKASGRTLARRDETRVRPFARSAETHGWSALRQRVALDGMYATSGQRYRLRAGADHGARCQGREGSHHDVADKLSRRFASPSGWNQSAARTRFRGRIWQR